MYQYNNRDSRNNNNVHNCYSITFLIVNLLFLIAIVYFIMHIDNDINVVIMEYVLFAHSAFGFAVSFVLLIMGVLLLRVLNQNVSNVDEDDVSLFTSDVDVDVDGALVPNTNDDSVDVNQTRKKAYHKVTKRNNISDIYSKTRKLQLLCIMLSNVFSDSVELVIHSLRFFVFEESFIGEQYIEVNDMKGFMVYNAELFSLWLSSFANYLTFYYIVRGSFRTKKATNTVRSSLFRESNLLRYRKAENQSENKDIQEYLLTNCN